MNPSRMKVIQEIKTHQAYKIIYWMQSAQRIHYNHALNYAIELANKNNSELQVIFNIIPSYKDANRRHYMFMLEGIQELEKTFFELKIPFKITFGLPEENISKHLIDGDVLILDKAYLKQPRQWRNALYQRIKGKNTIIEMDTELIVPVELASIKMEYGAYTIRPKLHKLFDIFDDHDDLPAYKGPYHQLTSDVDLKHINTFVESLPIDQSVIETSSFKGGYQEAIKRLQSFIQLKAKDYLERNAPGEQVTSTLSPYLHFGQISSLEIVHAIKHAKEAGIINQETFDGIFEQVFVRRELAFNFVYYNQNYDQFEYMTEPWAYKTMEEHQDDYRPFIYSRDNLEASLTHDPYFNAAMDEMKYSGYMHNYMRMYWAKKIIEWSNSYKEAYETTLYLNNKYFLDGRDPNSYTSVAWNYGRHDRAWNERTILGKLRYMNDKGLERKFDMKKYISFVESIKK
jgi:deoxyribodipyrimidine photo-lyase